MSAIHVDQRDLDTNGSLAKVQLRLVETLTDMMRPFPTQVELMTCIQRVAAELGEIREDLLLIYHVERDAAELEAKVIEVEQRLATGWKPEGSSADDLVKRLHSSAIRTT